MLEWPPVPFILLASRPRAVIGKHLANFRHGLLMGPQPLFSLEYMLLSLGLSMWLGAELM